MCRGHGCAVISRGNRNRLPLRGNAVRWHACDMGTVLSFELSPHYHPNFHRWTNSSWTSRRTHTPLSWTHTETVRKMMMIHPQWIGSTAQEITIHGLDAVNVVLAPKVVTNDGEDTYSYSSYLVSYCFLASCLPIFAHTIQWRELRDSGTASLEDSSNEQRVMHSLSSTGNVRDITSRVALGIEIWWSRLSDHSLRRAVFGPDTWNHAECLVLSRWVTRLHFHHIIQKTLIIWWRCIWESMLFSLLFMCLLWRLG